MIKNRHTCRQKDKTKLPVKYVFSLYLLVSGNEYLCMKMLGFIVVFCQLERRLTKKKIRDQREETDARN